MPGLAYNGNNQNYPNYNMDTEASGVNPYNPDMRSPQAISQNEFGDFSNYGIDMNTPVTDGLPYGGAETVPQTQVQPLQGQVPQGEPLGKTSASPQFSDYGLNWGQGQSNALMDMPQQPTDGFAGTAGSTLSQAGAVSSAITTPWTQAAGIGLQAVGQGLSIYDKYQQRDQAKQNYEAQAAEYQRRLDIEGQDRAREQARLARQEGYFGADYARNLGSDLAGQYQGYRQGGQ